MYGKYTDPSGETAWFIPVAAAIVGGYFGGVQANFFTASNPFNPLDWNWHSPSTYIGIASGMITGIGLAGIQMPTLIPQVAGIIPNGLIHAGANVAENGLINVISGDPFFENWEGAAISGFVNGAITGYQLADAKGLNLWWGKEIGYNRNKWSFFNWNKQDYEIFFGITNVGSKNDNDCVPTTFAEIEAKRGGTRTYENFIDITNYEENVGVSVTKNDYENLVYNTFDNVETVPQKDYYKLFDPEYMQNAANNNEIFSVQFKGHTDNVRSLKVFIDAPELNTLTFRETRYNLTRSGNGVIILNIFRFH